MRRRDFLKGLGMVALVPLLPWKLKRPEAKEQAKPTNRMMTLRALDRGSAASWSARDAYEQQVLEGMRRINSDIEARVFLYERRSASGRR